jgi:2-amino-4-hydroxy-6-hydroxymethyldihydropteridine diphosphokinase
MTQPYRSALVALGANLPFGGASAADNLRACRAVMEAQGIEIVSFSSIYATPCFPAGAGPDYANAAAIVRRNDFADPHDLLRELHLIEARFGRERATRWGMRTLDLDLLDFDGRILPDSRTQAYWRTLPLAEQIGATPDRLVLPHPRLQDRAFVLVPLAEIAPQWRHPVTGATVMEMLAALPPEDVAAISRLP